MNSARSLLSVQDADRNLARHRRGYRQIKDLIDSSGGLKDLRIQEERSKEKALSDKLRLAKMESELAAFKDSLERSDKRLYSGSITNAREVSALEAEKQIAEENIIATEEAMRSAKIALERSTARTEMLSKELAEREEEWKMELKELISKMNHIREDYRVMQKEREKAIDGVPEKDMTLYRSLLPVKNGLPVVKVRKDVCLGCNVRLPAGEIERGKKSKSLVLCSICGRILMFE